MNDNERTQGFHASQAGGTYADRLETLANVREAGISVSRKRYLEPKDDSMMAVLTLCLGFGHLPWAW